MIRLNEEQKAILNCYFGNKRKMMTELRNAIPFIEDMELRELSSELLIQVEDMQDDELLSIGGEGMLDVYESKMDVMRD